MAADLVILLHGIARTSRSMRGLARLLERSGYETLNIGYPSMRMPLEKLAEHVHAHASARIDACAGRVHFVGYSMGCLLIRAYLHRHRPVKLGRVVMLGPPNNGSEVADALKGFWFYRKLYGPAGQQLITDQQAIAHLFGPVDYELGVIAGSRSLDPVSSWIIGKPSDGKVSIESTKLPGMKAHAISHATHTFLSQNREARILALRFLQCGDFSAPGG